MLFGKRHTMQAAYTWPPLVLEKWIKHSVPLLRPAEVNLYFKITLRMKTTQILYFGNKFCTVCCITTVFEISEFVI